MNNYKFLKSNEIISIKLSIIQHTINFIPIIISLNLDIF